MATAYDGEIGPFIVKFVQKNKDFFDEYHFEQYLYGFHDIFKSLQLLAPTDR
jgi:hypothetical protein